MNTPVIDPLLVYLNKGPVRENGLTPEQRIALHVLWNDGEGVRVGILATAFKVSKNTIYYQALTGDADSYPTTPTTNAAAETKAIVDHLGVEEATRRFVTPKIKAAVEAALAYDHMLKAKRNARAARTRKRLRKQYAKDRALRDQQQEANR